jgi:hypothetical protein
MYGLNLCPVTINLIFRIGFGTEITRSVQRQVTSWKAPVRFPAVQDLPVLRSVQNYSVTQPPVQWVPGALSQDVKVQWREPDHTPPSDEIKKSGVIPHLPSYIFVA